MEQERKKRISLIDKATDVLRLSVENLAQSLALFLTGFFTAKLILDADGNIEESSENYAVINELEQAKSDFFTETVVPFLAGISLVFFDIQKLNKEYFNAVEQPVAKPPSQKPVEVDISDCVSGVEEEVREAFGFNITDDEVEINPTGWLANIGDLKSAYDAVRQSAMKAVSTRMSLDAFLKVLKTEVQGTDQFNGQVKGHFRTIVWDVFAEFDRHVGYKIAVCLGYRAAIYEGGLIDHSRDFCIERNGKVFTYEEIKKFGTPDDAYGGYSNKAKGDFDGKPKFDYEPFLDQGGYNCRHAYSYIPDRMAIRLRPELKEVFDGT